MPEELVRYPRALKEASRGELGLGVTTQSARDDDDSVMMTAMATGQSHTFTV